MAVDKKNIFLTHTMEAMSYVSSPSLSENRFPKRSFKSHAPIIEKKLQDCYKQSTIQKQSAAIRYKDGTYLEFSSASGYDLAIKSLESKVHSKLRYLTRGHLTETA